MTIAWSDHAKGQRAAILRTIAKELSREDASRWNGKFRDAVKNLSEFPESGGEIPEECFASVPHHADHLKQTLCNPYRIVYERAGEEIHVLAIMHTRMLVWTRDTHWT